MKKLYRRPRLGEILHLDQYGIRVRVVNPPHIWHWDDDDRETMTAYVMLDKDGNGKAYDSFIHYFPREKEYNRNVSHTEED